MAQTSRSNPAIGGAVPTQFEACCRCGQPIAPGEPAMQTASVDIIGGRAVSSPVKSYHLKGRCYDDAQRRETLPNAA